MQICICKYIFLALLALCRVSLQRHSANIHSLPCAWARAHGKEVFHVALRLPTLFCRVWSIAHGKIDLAHGKVALCRPLYAVRGLPCVTHGKYFAVCKPAFAVCLWHTANDLRPVVSRMVSVIRFCSLRFKIGLW